MGLFTVAWPIKIKINVVRPSDERGWIGLGAYFLVLVVFALMAWKPELRQDEFFKTVATLIVGAFIKDVVGWAFQATKGGTDLADRNAEIVKQQASNSAPTTVQGDLKAENIETVEMTK